MYIERTREESRTILRFHEITKNLHLAQHQPAVSPKASLPIFHTKQLLRAE